MAGLSPAAAHLQAAASAAELLELEDSRTFDGRGRGFGDLRRRLLLWRRGFERPVAPCGILWHPVALNCCLWGRWLGRPVAPCGALKSPVAASCYPYNPLVQEWQIGSTESFDVAGFA